MQQQQLQQLIIAMQRPYDASYCTLGSCCCCWVAITIQIQHALRNTVSDEAIVCHTACTLQLANATTATAAADATAMDTAATYCF
jgi:hypothetical protein